MPEGYVFTKRLRKAYAKVQETRKKVVAGYARTQKFAQKHPLPTTAQLLGFEEKKKRRR